MRAKKLATPPHNRGDVKTPWAGNGGHNLHIPTEESRVIVDALASCGVPHPAIGRVIGISYKTLELHYPEELEGGGWVAKGHIIKNAWSIAMDKKHPLSGQMTMFLCKTRCGFRETDRHENVVMNPDGSAADLQTVVILPANGREITVIPPPQVNRPGRPRKDVN